MKLELNKLNIIDIDGKELNLEIDKIVARMLRNDAQNFDLIEVARTLYEHGYSEVRESELMEIKQIVMGSKLPTFVKKAVVDYINSLQEKNYKVKK